VDRSLHSSHLSSPTAGIQIIGYYTNKFSINFPIARSSANYVWATYMATWAPHISGQAFELYKQLNSDASEFSRQDIHGRQSRSGCPLLSSAKQVFSYLS
jgi:hypothetical protein